MSDSVKFLYNKLYINGEWINSKYGNTLDSINPATGKLNFSVQTGTKEDVDLAVKSAKIALNGEWNSLSGAERSKYLLSISSELLKEKEKLSTIETLDNGKTIRESEADVEDAAACFEFYSKLAVKLDEQQGEILETGSEEYSTKLYHEPVGVCACITPFNFPLVMSAWKIAPALAAGCTVVLKPSEYTPLSALELANICDKIQLPKGVINVVNGDGISTGSPLVSHPDVDKVSFTGSVTTGQKIASQSGNDLKNFNLELGGKSPIIVFEDCDLNKTVDWVAFGIFGGKGEVCSATSRLLIEESFYDSFIEKLIKKLGTIKIGNGLNRDVVLGAIVSKTQFERVLNFIEIAKKEGDELLFGGKRPKESELTPLDGNFIEPTVFLSKKDSTIWKEEVFGPILSVMKFKTENEAIELANDTKYGLAASVMSSDAKRLNRIGKKLKSGVVWYNCSQPFFYEAPWGGMKKSGIGRELGKWGLNNYLQTRCVVSNEKMKFDRSTLLIRLDIRLSQANENKIMNRKDGEQKIKIQGIIHASTEKSSSTYNETSLKDSAQIEEKIVEKPNFLSWSTESSNFFNGKRLWGLNTGRGLLQKKFCHRQINMLLEIIPKEYFGKDEHVFYDYLCYTFRRCLYESKTLMLLANFDKKKETGTTWTPYYVKDQKTPILVFWNTGLIAEADGEPLFCALAPYIDQSGSKQKKTNEMYLQFFHKKSALFDEKQLKSIIGIHILDFTSKLLQIQNPKLFDGKLIIPPIQNDQLPQVVSYIDSKVPKDLLVFNPSLSVSTLELKSRSDLNLSNEQLNIQLNYSIENFKKNADSIVPFWNFKTNEMNFLLPFYTNSSTCNHAAVFSVTYVAILKSLRYNVSMIINIIDAYHRARLTAPVKHEWLSNASKFSENFTQIDSSNSKVLKIPENSNFGTIRKTLKCDIFKNAPSDASFEESVSHILSVNDLWKKELCIHFLNGDNRNGHLDKSYECGFAHGESEKRLWDSFRKERKIKQKI
eukprot:gene554-8066_t